MLAFEIALFYYAFFSWCARADAIPKHDAFSYHKENGYASVVAGIVVVMLIEMIALHTVLWLWKPMAAWVVTALSLYGFVWFLGDWRAIGVRPITLEKETLVERIGLRWTVRVPFDAITAVHPVKATPPAHKTPGYLEAVLWGKPQVLITMNRPIVAQGLYGLHKTISTLGLTLRGF